MHQAFDLLSEVFNRCILKEDLADLTPELFARVVAEDYLCHIQKEGLIIPQSSYHGLLAALQEEALVMYRMTTYGYYNLTAYQKSVVHKVSENDY